MENKTWDLVDAPKGVNLIGCRWVYKVKYSAETLSTDTRTDWWQRAMCICGGREDDDHLYLASGSHGKSMVSAPDACQEHVPARRA